MLKFDYYKNIQKNEMIYICDSLYSLLDADLSRSVKYKYNVNSINETNLILKILKDENEL